jgi:two-component system response regulator NreC
VGCRLCTQRLRRNRTDSGHPGGRPRAALPQSPLLERAIEVYIQKAQGSSLDLYETLTTREREVLQLAAQSCSNADIAGRLSISPRTVETYRANVMRKLALRTQTDLIRYALRQGILPMDD